MQVVVAATLASLILLSGQMCSPGPGPGPGPGGCGELSGTISSDTTLSESCYNVTGNVNVDAALTIDPGVTLEFDEGVWMSVNSGGSLNAVGTAAEPIVFTGSQAVRGYWGGLTFYYSNSLNNQLDHVVIEYGGAADEANLMTVGSSSEPARLSVTNSTLRNSAGCGFDLRDTTVMTEFANNTVTGNAVAAGDVMPNMIGWLDESSTFTGNTVDGLIVRGGTVSEDQTWAAIGVPYLVRNDIGIRAALTIAAGAELVFDSATTMTMYDEGSLSAVGTATDPILLTGSEEVPGYWGGLWCYYSNSANNRLEYVTIEYGGASDEANLITVGSSAQPARIAVSNCTFRNSAGYGVLLRDTTNMTEFSSNTLTGNELGAASVMPNMVGWLDAASDYQGNGDDVVQIRGGTISDPQTWQALHVDYFCDNDVNVRADLTIAAGARLVFGQGVAMTVHDDGSLRAVGTATNRITFTGEQATAGYWNGLEYYYSPSANNVLGYVTIEYGGGNDAGNLYLEGDSQATATNCAFTHSSTYGVYVNVASTINADVATANSFSANVSGDVFIEP